MNHSRWAGVAIIAALLIIFVAWTKTKPESWNDSARVAAIESLVDRGTWSIDGSLWVAKTKDKVLINGKFYSDKMPMLTFLGAGVYAVLHMAGASLVPDCRVCAYAPLTFIIVGLGALITTWLFFEYACRHVSLWRAGIGTFAFGFGTMIFPYALVLNHHVPAACVLFASFYLLTKRQSNNQWSMVGAGFLASLAISFDALTWITAAALLGIAFVQHRQQLASFVFGAAIPLAFTAILDYQITGTIIPPYMITIGYDYPDSAFPATFGGNGTPDDYAAYAFRMFLGGKGLFAFNPLLLFAVAGALRVAFTRQHLLRVEALAVVIGFAALCIYLATQTGNYGGQAYGERWFIPAIPLLFAFIFFAPPLDRAGWKHWAWIIFVPAFVFSVISGWQGAQAPWQDHLPVLQMTRDMDHFPFLGFRWNLRLP